MNTQPHWSGYANVQSARTAAAPAAERLARLKADLRETKAQLRQVLEALAARYDIPQRDVSYAIDGHADEMLADLVYGVERDLEHAVEEETPV